MNGKIKSVLVGVMVGVAIAMSTYQNIQLNSLKRKIDKTEQSSLESKENTTHILEEVRKLEHCAMDVQCLKLAEAIYFESGNNSYSDKIAIANVVKNRVQSGESSYIDILTERNKKICQFSYLCVRKSFTIDHDRMWRDSVNAASDVYYNKVVDTTDGALYYYAHKRIKKPKWARNMLVTKKTESHTFLKEKN